MDTKPLRQSVPFDAIERLKPSVQPLVFETAIEDFPYSAKGTLFLVGFEGRFYVVTTRHGLYPDGPTGPHPICVFPSDRSTRLLPLRNVFFVPRLDASDDFVDLAIIEVDPTAKLDPELNQATLINLDLAVKSDWASIASEMTFFVIGYPSERTSIDLETQEIRTDRATLLGTYKGNSPLPHLHLIQIENMQDVASLDGLSGSPVFMWDVSNLAQAKPILCGMAIRGTSSSQLLHFLPISILMDALKIKSKKHENGDRLR